jgi:hypothetical protein
MLGAVDDAAAAAADALDQQVAIGDHAAQQRVVGAPCPRRAAHRAEQPLRGELRAAAGARARLGRHANRCFLAVQEERGSFDSYIWRFVDGKPIRNRFRSLAELPAHTPLSDAVSKDLRQRGFKFVGSTIVYAHMQATGMVNNHVMSCFRFRQV